MKSFSEEKKQIIFAVDNKSEPVSSTSKRTANKTKYWIIGGVIALCIFSFVVIYFTISSAPSDKVVVVEPVQIADLNGPIFLINYDDTKQFFRAEGDGSNLRNITKDISIANDETHNFGNTNRYNYNFSADGKLVAYAEEFKLKSSIKIFNLEDRNSSYIGMGVYACFNQAGDTVAVIDGTGIYTIKLDRTGFRRIYQLENSERLLSDLQFSPDGKFVIFRRYDQRKYFKIDAVLSGMTLEMLPNVANCTKISFSADGTKIAYITSDKNSLIFVKNTRTEQTHSCQHQNKETINEITWSPDSKKLLVLSGGPINYKVKILEFDFKKYIIINEILVTDGKYCSLFWSRETNKFK